MPKDEAQLYAANELYAHTLQFILFIFVISFLFLGGYGLF